jgi:phenylacetate-CoA ligase
MIWNHTMEKAGREEMQALQLVRLRQTVERAYHCVPLYRAKMEAAGVKPDDIRSLDDIARLPFTTKQDMRDAYPYGAAGRADETGGAGALLQRHDRQADGGGLHPPRSRRVGRVLARTLVAGGLSDSSVFQVAVNYGLFTGGLGFHYAAEMVGASVVPISGGNTVRQVMLIKDFGTTAMIITRPIRCIWLRRCGRWASSPRTRRLSRSSAGRDVVGPHARPDRGNTA